MSPTEGETRPSEERIEAIVPMLAEQPAGFGRPIDDRDAWDRLAKHKSYAGIVAKTEGLLKEAFPEQPDDLYLDFSRTGNRTRWQRVAGQRRGRVASLVLAECIENKGRFVAAFEAVVQALCAEPTWVMPAHDRGLGNFKGKQIDIDLGSATLAWQLATAHYLLGDRLSRETRQLICDNVRRRILDPYRDMATGKRRVNWWMKTTNNWNAVCLAGVTGSALTLLGSRAERAFFVAAAEEFSKSFLRGFTSDGYCSEGLGYWNYGFGYYVMLAEEICQATRGQVDLMAREEVKAPATFGVRIEIMNGVYPAFADCGVGGRPSALTMHYVSRRYGLGLKRWEDTDTISTGGGLHQAMVYSFPHSASETPPAAKPSLDLGVRSWFEKAGILIGRPPAGSECRLGVALKGGHNAEHHNHNDVGSYLVVVGSQAVLVDPGSEVYTARTFSRQRYVSKVLNSYGHPVPVVAGKLQRTGRQAQARVLSTELTDAADKLLLDVSPAYSVPGLKKLQRSFLYSRTGAGSLTITDEVELDKPGSFGTALVTFGEWKQLDANSLMVYDFEEAVRVEIESGGCAFEVAAEQIENPGKPAPTRLGINLKEPVTAATVSVTITPMAFSGDGDSGQLLRNGGFELGSWAWRIPKNGMGSVSDEQAATGQHSLKIVDESKKRGSNISSARLPIDGPGSFELRGKVFRASGNGVGMYLKYWDANGKLLNKTDHRGWISGVTTAQGPVGEWAPFKCRFTAPPDTASLQIWIHSANAAKVAAYLDDLEIVRSDP